MFSPFLSKDSPLAALDNVFKQAALRSYEEATKEPPQDACNYCDKSTSDNGGPLMRCSQCRVGQYCSKACQKKHWKDHKEYCEKYCPAKKWKVQRDFTDASEKVMFGPSSSTEEGAANYKKAADAMMKMQHPNIRSEGDARLLLEKMSKGFHEKIFKHEDFDKKYGDEKYGDEEDGDENEGDEKDGGEEDGGGKESLNCENNADGKDCSTA